MPQATTCRDGPELERYGKVRLSTAGRLRSLGFALVPTLDRPHYDVVLPDLADATLDRLEIGFDRPVPNSSRIRYVFPMASWDLWLDYHRRDADGLTHGNVRNARAGLAMVRGQHVVVGNEDAHPAVAENIRLQDDGVVLVRVVPGTLDDNRSLLQAVPAPR